MNVIRKREDFPNREKQQVHAYTTIGIDAKLSLTQDYKPYVVLDITTSDVDLATNEKVGPEVHNVFYLNKDQTVRLLDLLVEMRGPNDQHLDKYTSTGKPGIEEDGRLAGS